MSCIPLLAALMACAASRPPREAWNWPVDCPRLATLLLTKDLSDSVWNPALPSIYSCPEHAAGVLAQLWDNPPADSARRRQVHAISGEVSDRKLFHSVARTLADTARPTLDRFDALGVLVRWADSTAVLAVNPVPGRAPNGEIVSVTPAMGFVAPAHVIRRAGRFPLGEEDRREILGVIRRVALDDPVTDVRAVAQYVDGRLGGLPPRPGWR
jgi:hypothetical protein